MNQNLSRFKKELRKNQTDAEQILWKHLRGRRFLGWKIRRQHTLQGYIVDFVCLERKIIIELDGGQHAKRKTYDAIRTRILERDGYKVIRFWNNDVMYHLDDVLHSILNTPHPACGRPLPQGERWSARPNALSSPENTAFSAPPHPACGRFIAPKPLRRGTLPQGERWSARPNALSSPESTTFSNTPHPLFGRPLPQGERWNNNRIIP